MKFQIKEAELDAFRISLEFLKDPMEAHGVPAWLKEVTYRAKQAAGESVFRSEDGETIRILTMFTAGEALPVAADDTYGLKLGDYIFRNADTGTIFGVTAAAVAKTYRRADRTAEDALAKLLEMVHAEKKTVSLEPDWGGGDSGCVTIIIAEPGTGDPEADMKSQKHTHFGWQGATTEEVVEGFRKLLMGEVSLSWAQD